MGIDRAYASVAYLIFLDETQYLFIIYSIKNIPKILINQLIHLNNQSTPTQIISQINN